MGAKERVPSRHGVFDEHDVSLHCHSLRKVFAGGLLCIGSSDGQAWASS